MIQPARTRQKRAAGDDHQVVTVEGGGGQYRRTPCQDCPWRRDAVGKFPAEAFVHSANTAAEMLDGPCVDAFRRKGEDGETSLTILVNEVSHTFGCHRSGTEKPATCAGYILRATNSLSWRIAVLSRKFNPHNVRTNGVRLFQSYFVMAVANGVPTDHPALAACRPWQSRPRHPGGDHRV